MSYDSHRPGAMAYLSINAGGALKACGLAAGLLVATLVGACSNGGSGPDAQTGSLNLDAGKDRPLVKVAVLVPLSAQGQPGAIGKSLQQAAELALFERDNNLQLIVKDDKGTPEGAKAAAE